MCYGGSAQWTGCVGGAVLGQCPQTRLTEDVAAGMAHVWTEVDIQTHSTNIAFTIPAGQLLILTAARWVPCRALQQRGDDSVLLNSTIW